MALGKRRRERQLEAFVLDLDVPKSPGHPCYTAPNCLVAERHGLEGLHEEAGESGWTRRSSG
jgi:hypothetical protein